MPAAARLLDFHVCPAFNGLVPHVGGPIITFRQVFIGGFPAAVKGDNAICVGGSVATIQNGSATVMIEGQAAARMGDPTSHGGSITTGFANVIIGG